MYVKIKVNNVRSFDGVDAFLKDTSKGNALDARISFLRGLGATDGEVINIISGNMQAHQIGALEIVYEDGDVRPATSRSDKL